ncbi:MAG: hypothetical protein ACXWP0_06810 [Ktedonobacterales bacterium]
MHPLPRVALDISSWLVEHNPLPVRELCAYDSSGFDARSVYVESIQPLS